MNRLLDFTVLIAHSENGKQFYSLVEYNAATARHSVELLDINFHLIPLVEKENVELEVQFSHMRHRIAMERWANFDFEDFEEYTTEKTRASMDAFNEYTLAKDSDCTVYSHQFV